MAASKPGGSKKPQKNKSNTAKNTVSPKSVKITREKPTPQQMMARRQKSGIIFMAVAIFLICVVVIEGQNVWTALHNGMLGLFGYCAYVWPLMLIYMAVVCALDKPLGSISVSVSGIAAFIVMIGGAIHIFANDKGYLQDNAIWVQIRAGWDERTTTPNGGFFGALTGGLLAKLFGKPGAEITIVLLLIVMFMFLTGTTLFGLFQTISKPVKKVSQYTGEKIEMKAQKREQIKTSKKPFNPPKVLTDEESMSVVLDNSNTGEFVPAVPADALPEHLQYKTEYEQEAVAIPSFKKGGGKATLEDIIHSAAPEKEAVQKPRGKEQLVKTELEYEEEEEEVFKTYQLPPIDCLNKPKNSDNSGSDDDLKLNGQKLIETLQSFGVQAKIVMISRGPSVTRYELQPEPGIRINRITNLADDIAMRLAASSVRIEAPIPNKSAIGIEVPNSSKSAVCIREIIDTNQFRTAKSKLSVALGKDITGNVICADLVKMPHLLIAGTTGSGKSVCLNALIISLLYHATPDEVKLLLIDPKAVELAPYNGIAHLEVPVVSDPRKAAGALGWAVTEMQQRYKLFTEKNVRDIEGYNKLADKSEDMKRMHQVVIFIDELNDLMMVAPNEVEDSICRLAQMARAAGMHLVIATQRPSVDVITGIIKANIPSRIALSVSSQVDSRTIIDMSGAEKLLGSGDMLFNPVGISKPVRIQGCYISEQEIENVVKFIKNQTQSTYDEGIMEEIERHAVATKKKGASADSGEDGDETDEMLPKAIEVVVAAQMASTTLLQRKLKLGYARAARLVDVLETKGIVGPFEGSKPRKVLISKQQWMEMNALNADYTLPEPGEYEEQ